VPALALPIPTRGPLPGQRSAGVFVGQRGASARRGGGGRRPVAGRAARQLCRRAG
jgi:hypothetical protein